MDRPENISRLLEFASLVLKSQLGEKINEKLESDPYFDPYSMVENVKDCLDYLICNFFCSLAQMVTAYPMHPLNEILRIKLKTILTENSPKDLM